MSSAAQLLPVICPAFATLPAGSQAIFLEMATLETDSGYFGVYYQKAIALRAAHEFTLASRSAGASGNVASMSEGGLSISYGAGAAANTALGNTHYGQQLLELMKSIGPGIFVTGTSDTFVEDEG